MATEDPPVTAEAAGNMETSVKGESPPPLVRRSGRARKRPGSFQGDNLEKPTSVNTATASTLSPEEPRRNPRRKAAPEQFDIPSDLLENSLAPMGKHERSEWASWTEVESDPAFFNTILQELGVHDIQARELFSLDFLGDILSPVYGLVFLYQYLGEDSEDGTEDSSSVWFANQTTANACATVALLNIIMNAENIELGSDLNDFKSQTREMDPPLRGHMITTNAAIRTAHNSFARRIDLLNADLCMENDVQDAKKKNKGSSKGRGRPKKKGPQEQAAYHFIAYVPLEGKVWQLDGLQSYPTCLGAFEGDWTESARPVIETRMLQYETEQVSFNLLALCRNPLGSIRRDLVEKIRCYDILVRTAESQGSKLSPSWVNGDSASTRQENLALYGLSEWDVQAVSDDKTEKTLGVRDTSSYQPAELAEIASRLEREQEQLRSEYTAQLASMDDDAGVATGRKKDYSLVIHEWIKKLVDRGVLHELLDEADHTSLLSS